MPRPSPTASFPAIRGRLRSSSALTPSKDSSGRSDRATESMPGRNDPSNMVFVPRRRAPLSPAARDAANRRVDKSRRISLRGA